MTCMELAQELLKTPNLRVVVEGYEGGYCFLEQASITKEEMFLNMNRASWEGPHEKVSYFGFGQDLHKEYKKETCLILGRP